MYFNWTGNAGVTPNGADTERYDAFDTGVSFVVFELADKLQASSGASGTSTATYGGATSGGMAATIALAPPSGSSPVADFTGTPLTGARPLSVAFTDASTNTPTSWSWTFGDGGTSSSQNPTHSYTAAGTYNVALTATNAFGSDTKTRTGYVTVANPSGTLTKIKWGDHLAVTDEGGGVIRVDYVP
jgi:PKD repeat protein